MTTIAERLSAIKSRLPEGTTLVAVSKTHPIDKVLEAYKAGQRIFGENRVQELVPKYDALPKDIQWHLIGHLQSNKVKYIAPFVHLIHSVDSEKLLQEIDKQAYRFSRKINVLLQVFVADEETKFGFDPNEVLELFTSGKITSYKNIHVLGLMAMATNTDDREKISAEFKTVHELYTSLNNLGAQLEILSMGMSSDWEIAVRQGSTMIRVGSTIFGNR